MQTQTKRTLLAALALLLVAGAAAWWRSGFSLEFMRFFAAPVQSPAPTLIVESSPTPAAPVSTAILPTPPPGAVRCSPASQTQQAGIQLTFLATGGTGPYEWFVADQEAPESAGNGSTFTFTFSTPGTKQVLVQSPRRVGVSDVGVCTVTITQ